MGARIYSLTRDQVRELCPSCADKMQLARIKELKLSTDDLGNLLPQDEVTIKLFAGFSQGMCDKFGPDDGMFTRCAETMTGKVDDEKAFCAALHKFCVGKWPAEKKHGTLEEGVTYLFNAMPQPVATAVQPPLRKMFDEILQEKEVQDKANRIVWSINDSISRIVDDKTLTASEREGMLFRSLLQFMATVRTELPTLTTLSDAETVVKKYNSMMMSREEMLTKCKKDHPDWTPAQHEAWVTKEMKKKKPMTFTEDLGVEDDSATILEYSNAIKGVEVFKTGTHNGDEYTGKDLDDMVGAFKELDYSPAIKVGHTKDAPGCPAYGWVKNLRRVGDKLYADFEDMHDSVVDAVRNRLYDRVSAEIYFNLKRGEKTFRRALKAVALLGAEVPAVANLTPLHKMEFVEGGFDAVGVFEADLDIPTETMLETLSTRVAGLVTLIKEYGMKKNAEQIKALKAQVDDFGKKMAELKKKKGAATDEELEDDEEYKQLSAQADEISDRIAELEADEDDGADEIESLHKQLAESKAREDALRKDQDATSARIAKLEQKDLNDKIGARVKACKIPAFRDGLSALYNYALSHADEKVKVYAEKDGKTTSEDKSLTEVVDGFVSNINEQSEKLFKALAFSGASVRQDGTISEDVGAEVQKRVADYRLKNPTVKLYEEAMKAVLSADPELSEAYRKQAGREQ